MCCTGGNVCVFTLYNDHELPISAGGRGLDGQPPALSSSVAAWVSAHSTSLAMVSAAAFSLLKALRGTTLRPSLLAKKGIKSSATLCTLMGCAVSDRILSIEVALTFVRPQAVTRLNQSRGSCVTLREKPCDERRWRMWMPIDANCIHFPWLTKH